jgi:hypothetical protein
MGTDWPTYVGMSSLAWFGFNHHVLRSLLCIPWHWMSLINTWFDALSVLAVMGGFWSTNDEMHFCFRWNILF